MSNEMMTIEAERVTRATLRSILPNTVVRFILPTPKACESARSAVHQLRVLEGLQLSAKTDYINSTIVIERR